MQTTTNYGFIKPEVTDNYDVEQFNQTFDIIDTELKAVADKAESSTTHPKNKDNPHEVSAVQVGLGNVPNVATNDQTPTYVVAAENAALSSGEKLSVAFGKIAKAISSLISHLADTVGHITSTERTNWNDANSKKHSHSNMSVLNDTTASYTTEEQTKLNGIAAGANAYTHPSSHPASMIDGLATVAKSGKYSDLSGTPTIPTNNNQLTNGAGYITGINKTMVTNALGYTPPASDTNTWRPLGTTADTACAGNDSRLSNARPASDVYAWAKASSKPSYTISEISGTVAVAISSSQPSSGLWVVP